MLDAPFRGTPAVATGLVSRQELRGRRYRRLFPDVYASAALVADLVLRSRAAYLWSGGRGILGGYAAAAVLGADCAPADVPVEVILGRSHRRAPAGLVVRQDELAGDEWRTTGGIDVTTPLRTAYDLARRDPLTEAVVALDALSGRFGFAPVEVLTLAERYPGARGTLRLPEVVSLAEPAAASAMESRLRLVLVLAGLPRPVAQHQVRDADHRLVATVDLAYPDELIAIEYEGEDHFTDERGRRDVYRYTCLVDAGWRVYRHVARDVYHNPARIVADISRALHHLHL
ncbi:endonuclease domain-containing protein [Pseudonocardia acaciae]|uniref:endonuclease domain-containing protein n=1 Tax=Pseudonocardia acaciae TaxID=551276 RepID=UPI0005627EAD|nr:hypothetical protein [Pseudonocardia acaciae]